MVMFTAVRTYFATRLERKLALLLSLVALFSLVIIGWLAIPTITNTRQQDVSELEWQLVNQLSTRLKKYMDDKLEQFRINVADPNVTAIGPDQQAYILRGQLEADSSLVEVAFLRPSDGAVEQRVVRGQDEAGEADQNPEPELLPTVMGGNNYLGDVHFVNSNPRVTLGSPVVNQQGQVISILRGEVDLSVLNSLVAQANLGSQGYLYVVDQRGRMLAHSSNLASSRHARLSEVAPLVARKLLVGAVLYTFRSSSQYYSSLSEQPVFAVARSLPSLRWGVVAEWPESEAMGPVADVVARLLGALFGILAIIIALSVYVARRFTRPLRTLRHATESIGQGKFDVDITRATATRDEVGDLARSFSGMTEGLKELERLKDEFVFIAAHELRTPVTAIRGYAEMLGDLKEKIPPQGSEFVTRLQQSGARLANLVNDLLEVARSQAGRLKVQTSPQDLVALIQTTLAELKPLVAEKKHTLTFTPPAALPTVMADKDKLQEVLVNLIGNAIKYTPVGGQVQVAVSVKADRVVTAITDTGIGIAPQDQAKLFERFFRVESDATKNIQGTGLGLFIVRQLVERMDGKIWVTSEVGKGSTFSFSLPSVTIASTSV